MRATSRAPSARATPTERARGPSRPQRRHYAACTTRARSRLPTGVASPSRFGASLSWCQRSTPPPHSLNRLRHRDDAAPLGCRLSVCFGDRIAVPRLLGGDGHGDCGAGRDFVSITPDRRVQSCSFQDRSLPGATADEIMTAWRLQQPMLTAPAARRGCARALPVASGLAAAPPIAIWQSYSGNNSGECVLVATFRELEDAEAYLAELLPGWVQAPSMGEFLAANLHCRCQRLRPHAKGRAHHAGRRLGAY